MTKMAILSKINIPVINLLCTCTQPMMSPPIETQTVTKPLLPIQQRIKLSLATQLMATPLLATQLMSTPLRATQRMTKLLLASVVATKPAVIHKTTVQNQATVYRKTVIQTQYWNSGTVLTQFKMVKQIHARRKHTQHKLLK